MRSGERGALQAATLPPRVRPPRGYYLAAMNDHDFELVRQLLAGDETAFRAFFDDYFPRLYRFAIRRVGGEQETARDVVQAALSKAVRKLESFRGEASLFTWLCQIVRHEVADYVARSERHATFTRRLTESEDEPAVRASLESLGGIQPVDPEVSRHQDEVTALVHAALDYLPRRYAEVLELKYLQDLSVDVIAKRLGVTAVSVQSLLARARAAFRDANGALAEGLVSASSAERAREGGGQ